MSSDVTAGLVTDVTAGMLGLPVRIDVPDDPYADEEDDKRLWIGNLDYRMSEYNILKLVQKFGSIRKMDFIYHKAGPDKGKPKGYCFVSFHSWEAAEKSRKALDGKMALGKPLYVKWAHGSKPVDPGKQIKVVESLPHPSDSSTTKEPASTLPLAKPPSTKPSSSSNLSNSTTSSNSLATFTLTDASPQSKIQAIEAKLRAMEESSKDFGVNDTIKAPNGTKPLSLYQKSDAYQSSSRSGPYRRNNSAHTHRHRRR